jgi:hypothetical protein
VSEAIRHVMHEMHRASGMVVAELERALRLPVLDHQERDLFQRLHAAHLVERDALRSYLASVNGLTNERRERLAPADRRQ